MDKEERIKYMRKKTQVGYTVIEMVIICILVCILVTLIVWPRVQHYSMQKREEKLKCSVAALSAAINNYYSDYGRYPQTLCELEYAIKVELEGMPKALLRHDLYSNREHSLKDIGTITIVALPPRLFDTFPSPRCEYTIWGHPTGGWIYNRIDGRIRVFCNHKSSIGIPYWKYGHEY